MLLLILLSIIIVECSGILTDFGDISLTSPTQSTRTGAEKALDGNTAGRFPDGSCTHTKDNTGPAWWKADMGSRKCVGKVVIWNRVDCCEHRLDNVMIKVGDNPDGVLNPVCNTVTAAHVDAGQKIELNCEMYGRYLTFYNPGTVALTLCEVKAREGFCPGQAEIELQSTSQSSTKYNMASDLAVDGKTNGGVLGYYDRPGDVVACTHTEEDSPTWWKADMGSRRCVGKVFIWNRAASDCCEHRIDGAMLKVGDNSDGTLNPVCDRVIVDQVDAGMVIELHCEMMGRYLTIQLPGSEKINVCEIKAYEGTCTGHDWHLIFRAVTGVPNLDPYDLWISEESHNDYVPDAQELTNEYRGHYKNKIVQQWEKLDISEVKVALYKDGSIVKELIFDGSGSNSNNWFKKSRLISSPWSDLGTTSTTNFFGISGMSETGAVRRFYISQSRGGCNVDAGWLAMATSVEPCNWGKPPGVSQPIFLFSNKNTATIWSEGASVSTADVFAIFIKIPRRAAAVPEIMHSNSRLVSVSGGPTINSGLSFGQCNTECQLNSACTSFNHNTESMTCELNTVEASDAVLHEADGWDFYPAKKNFGGKCANNPCENSGFCQLSSNILGYRCLCPPAYYGTDCQHHRT